MTDPQRLIELGDGDAASAFERELLGSLKPSGDAQSAVWRRMAAQGVLVAGVTTAAGTAAIKVAAATGTAADLTAAAATGKVAAGATSLTASLAAKVGLALIVAAPVVGGTLYLGKGGFETRPRAAAVQPAPVVDRPQALQAKPLQAPAKDQAESEPPTDEPAKAEATVAPAKQAGDALKEENSLLREARTADHAGDPQQALRILDELDRRFARGALLQEREILRISALSSSGSVAAAKARAKRFLERYPSSPYAAHAQAVLANGTSANP